MTDKQLWLSAKDPVRNGRGGYEFEGDHHLDRYIVETDSEITAGLDDDDAQAKLRELRPLLLKAARMRHRLDCPYPEYQGTSEQRFRIALTAEDLAAVAD